MTWVLGTNTPFGYAVGLSDICVSVDSTQFDCLQKIYPISRFLAAGFAGSVQIGFEIVDELRKWLVPIPEGGAYVRADVASKFPHIAQEIFNASPVERQQYGSNIMLLCVDPMPDGGSEPQSEIYIFRHPSFTAERIANVRVVSIGSGAVDYQDILQHFNEKPFSYLQRAIAGPDGVARDIGSTAKKRMQERPVQGGKPAPSRLRCFSARNRAEAKR